MVIQLEIQENNVMMAIKYQQMDVLIVQKIPDSIVMLLKEAVLMYVYLVQITVNLVIP